MVTTRLDGLHSVGAWNQFIGIVKRSLIITIGSRKCSFNTFSTIIEELESMFNSGTVTHVTESVENDDPLTTNNFILHCLYSKLPLTLLEET